MIAALFHTFQAYYRNTSFDFEAWAGKGVLLKCDRDFTMYLSTAESNHLCEDFLFGNKIAAYRVVYI